MRLFGGRRRARPVPLPPGFEVRVTLRKGDKIVRRDARGRIQIVRVGDGGRSEILRGPDYRTGP